MPKLLGHDWYDRIKRMGLGDRKASIFLMEVIKVHLIVRS